MDEIDRIYDGILEKSLLRYFVVINFLNNVASDRQSILETAPEAFVREYAIHASSGADRIQRPKCDYYSRKYLRWGKIRLDNILVFQIQDLEELAFLHMDVICRDLFFAYGEGT